MAIDCSNKENMPPSPAAAVPMGHRSGIAIKKCRLKRLGRPPRRVPLQDITHLFVGCASVLHLEALQPCESSVAVAEDVLLSLQTVLADGVGVKNGRYSLRKELR